MFQHLRPIGKLLYKRGGRAPIRTRRRNQPLRLELLEDRTMPAITITDMAVPTWANQGASVAFSASAESTDSSPLTYDWDFGGNLTAQGTSVTQAFGAVTPAGQPRTIRLGVADGLAYTEETRSLEIRNVAPSATLTSNLACLYTGDTISLTATATDPGGSDDPLTIDWDLHYDGSTFNADANAGSSLTQTRTFDTAGAIVVAVRATDQSGATSVATRNLTVTALPTIAIESDADPIIIDQSSGYYMTFDGDSQGFATIAWDLNYNGSTFVPDSNFTDWYIDASFPAAGNRILAAKTTDLAGQELSTSKTITIHYPPPVLTVGNDLTLNVGEPVTLQASVADPGAITNVQWYFSYDVMDYELEPNLTQLSQTDFFDHYGEYDVGVRVTDNHGEQAEDGFHVSVIAPRPTADVVTVNGPINQCSAATFTVHLNDPDEADVVNVYADWNGLDQFDEIAEKAYTLHDDGSFSFDHVYDYPGTYTAKIRLDDENGFTRDYTLTPLVVTPVQLSGTLTTDSPFSWNATAGKTWLMGANNAVGFIDVTAPDVKRLEYHFEFTNTADSTVLPEIVTNSPYCSLPSYAAGKAYSVRAWFVNLLASQDNPNPETVSNYKSNDYTTRLIAGSYAIPLWGNLSMADPAELDNGKVGVVKIESNTETTITFTINREYREIWPNDVPVHIYLHVTVQDTGATWLGLGDPSYGLVSEQDVEPDLRYSNFQTGVLTFTLPGYANNRQINTNVVIIPNEAPYWYLGTRASAATNPNSFPAGAPGPNVNMVNTITAWTSGTSGTSTGTGGSGQPGQLDPGTGGSGGGPTYSQDFVSPGVSSLTLLTTHVPEPWEQVSQALKLAETLANQFSANATELVKAVAADPDLLIRKLFDGLQKGLKDAFNDLTTPTAVVGNLLSWLTGGAATTRDSLQAVIDAAQTLAPNPLTSPNLPVFLDKLKGFFLEYAGLTWSNVQTIIQQQLGAGNYAIAERIFTLLGNLDTGGASAMWDLVNNLPARLSDLASQLNTDLAEQLGRPLDVPLSFQDLATGFDWSALANQLKDRAIQELTNSLISMAPRLLAKFDPTAGALVSLYDGFNFLINNSSKFADFFQGVSNAMGSLAAIVNDGDSDGALFNAFSNGVKNAVTGPGLNMLLNFGASQLGLGDLPQRVKNVLQFIPNTVDNLLRRMIGAVVSRIAAVLPGNGSTGLTAGLVGRIQRFTYENQSYTLWAAKPRTGPIQIKVAQGSQLVGVLTEGMFNTVASRTQLATVIRLAGAVTDANNTTRQSSDAVGPLTAAETELVRFVTTCPCTLLNTGCFAAGTKLWTPIGYRAIEEIQPGEPVYSRNEFDPTGPIDVKMVEETFTRFAPILHLHVGGQIIRTTGEHPFFAYDKGWTKAAALQIGDRLLTAAGEWALVEDLLDTGEWEPVYNLRVADHHTYFVGDWTWGLAVWAHNSYTPVTGAEVAGVTGGNYFTFTEGTYSAVWFVPNRFLVNRVVNGVTLRVPNQTMKDAFLRDMATGFGNTLQNRVNELRTQWNTWDRAERYGSPQEATRIDNLCRIVSDLRVASGGAAFTLDEYDNLSTPDPELTPNPVAGLGAAWVTFKMARALTRGRILHHKLDLWIQTQANAGYHGTGPDVDEHSGLQVWYEMYPEDGTGGNRRQHANRPGMDKPWRETRYGNGR